MSVQSTTTDCLGRDLTVFTFVSRALKKADHTWPTTISCIWQLLLFSLQWTWVRKLYFGIGVRYLVTQGRQSLKQLNMKLLTSRDYFLGRFHVTLSCIIMQVWYYLINWITPFSISPKGWKKDVLSRGRLFFAFTNSYPDLVYIIIWCKCLENTHHWQQNPDFITTDKIATN